MIRFPDGFDGLSDVARELLRGAIDIHVHAAPDPYTRRRLDALALARQASSAGMAGVVLKSHEYPTQPLAWAVEQALPGFRAWGGVALDHGVGGINPEAVRVSLSMGARVVWMPTFDAAHWRTFRQVKDARGEGIGILDEAGRIIRPCHEVLDLLAEHDAVLASGHLSTPETLALLTEAHRRGIRSVITHASFWIPVEAQQQLAALGVYVEQCVLSTLPTGGSQPFDELAAQVRMVGSSQVILATDLGQLDNPDPPLGFGAWIDAFLGAGFSRDEVATMVQRNPAALLG
jgi:hypothetical protein